MAGDLRFVLRWEINDATATLEAGRAESEEFKEGGFRWTIAVCKRVDQPEDKIDFTLRCDVDHSGRWKCKADVDMSFVTTFGASPVDKKRCSFSDDCKSWQYEAGSYWSNFSDEMINIDDKVTIEFDMHVISSERSKFHAANRRSDVKLLIGEEKLHVSKELLSIHSPVFEAMFFGDYAEKGKDEVEIKDVDSTEFIDILNIIYVDSLEITDHTVHHILRLGDRFQMESVQNEAVKFIMKFYGYDMIKKLEFADRYRLTSLRDFCLNSFSTALELSTTVPLADEFIGFSPETKTAICERIATLMSDPEFGGQTAETKEAVCDILAQHMG